MVNRKINSKFKRNQISIEVTKFPYGYRYLSEKEANQNRKTILIGIYFYYKTMDIHKTIDTPLSSEYQISQSYINKSYNSYFNGSLKSPSTLLDYIMELKGGDDEWSDKEMKNLIRNVISKTPQALHKEISFNKLIKKILKIIDPIISDQRFWRILNELTQ